MTSFGDPKAPKFHYGLKEDSPVNWDLNWRVQIKKEKKQMAANQERMEALQRGEQLRPHSSRHYHPVRAPSASSSSSTPSKERRTRPTMGAMGSLVYEDEDDLVAMAQAATATATSAPQAATAVDGESARTARSATSRSSAGAVFTSRSSASSPAAASPSARTPGTSRATGGAPAAKAAADLQSTGLGSAREDLAMRLQRAEEARTAAERKVQQLAAELDAVRSSLTQTLVP